MRSIMYHMSQYATIRVKPETKEKIARLGSYNDTMDGILNRLVETTQGLKQ